MVGAAYRLVERIDNENYKAVDQNNEKFLIRIFYVEPSLLQRELQIGRSVDHPNLAPFVDGRFDCEPMWMARPWLEGRPLAVWLKQGPQPVEFVTSFLEQTLNALEHLHSQGILYRNWTTDKLILSGDRWILTEVGLGSINQLAGAAQVRSGSYEPGIQYMAPEIFMGASFNPKSDLYGTASLAYHLLTGQAPYRSDNDAMKTLFRIVHENPTPLMENRPDLPRNLVDLVEALMSKSPDDRPDDIFEMLARLREKPAPAAQEAASEMGRFLDQAGREGQKDEKDGRFTLNPVKALEKLAQFQFARPHDYLLPLVAAGHALESSAITFRTSKSGLRVHYDCPELEKQQIEQIFLAAVQSAENPLHHLGRGIVGVLSRGARVALTSGRWQAKFEGLNPPSLTPGRSKGVTLSMSGELPQTFPPELLRRVQLSEAGVSWNGHLLNLQHELELLGEREGFRIFGSYCSQEPGFFLRVDGLTYQGGFHALSPTQLLLDGPWPLDISYRGISDNRLKERLGELARELLLDKIKDLLLTQPLRWDRPKDYLQLLPLVKDQDVQNKFASRVVLAAPDPYKLTGPAELETLLANACDLVRSQKLSSARRAGTLLVAPALESRE